MVDNVTNDDETLIYTKYCAQISVLFNIKKTLARVVISTDMPDLTDSFLPIRLAKAITAKRTGMKLTLVDVSEVLSNSKPSLIKIKKGNTNVNSPICSK